MGVLSAWIAEVGILTYRAYKNGQGTLAGLPLPSEYAATFVYYGSLSLVRGGSNAGKFATALAWGMTVATFMNLPWTVGNVGKKSSSSSTPTTSTTPARTGVTS